MSRELFVKDHPDLEPDFLKDDSKTLARKAEISGLLLALVFNEGLSEATRPLVNGPILKRLKELGYGHEKTT